jgi:hypothetical protein
MFICLNLSLHSVELYDSKLNVKLHAKLSANAHPLAAFGPSVWSSVLWENRGDMFAMPFQDQTGELQDPDIKEDDTEQGEKVRHVVDSVLED